MENKEFFIPKTKFKSYIKVILEFDNLINDYYKTIKEKKTTLIKDNGYLIDKKIFDKLKEELSYLKFKTYIREETEFNKKLNEKYGNSNHIKINGFEQEKFNTFKELLANLSKGNEYIIINTEVWKKFNNGRYKENEGKIGYEINEINFVINLNEEKVYFKHNFNIIKSGDLLLRIGTKVSKDNGEDSSYYHHPNIAVDINKTIESREKLIVQLYSSLIEYNNFQNFLITQLKEKNKSNNNCKIMEGYFIDMNWFQKWKQYTDYDNNRYLLNDLMGNKDKIKNNIKNNYKNDLKETSIIKYFSEDEFILILKNDILILVRQDFAKIFEKETNDIKKYKILFTIRNHQLIFFNKNKKQIGNVYSINNILPIESHKSFQISNNLIELYIFQEQLKLRIKQGKKNEKENLILVDKNFMDDFKENNLMKNFVTL